MSNLQKVIVPNVEIRVHQKQSTVSASGPSTSFVTVLAIKPTSSQFSGALEIFTGQLTTVDAFLPFSTLALLCGGSTTSYMPAYHMRAMGCDALLWNRKFKEGQLLLLYTLIPRSGAKLPLFKHPKLPSKVCMTKPSHWLTVHSACSAIQNGVLFFFFFFIWRIILKLECQSG